MRIFKTIERNGRKILKKILAIILKPGKRSYSLRTFKKVLILRLDERLGNIVLLNSVVRSFIKNKSNICLVVCEKYGKFYDYFPGIDQIIYFNKKNLFNPFNIVKLIVQLRRESYDLLFDASNPNDLSTLTFFTVLCAKANIKFGYDRKESNLILNYLVKLPEQSHILKYYQFLFDQLKLNFYRDISFDLPKYFYRKYLYLRRDNQKMIIVHPGGRSNKNWGVKKFLLLIKKIKRKQLDFLVLLGPDEKRDEDIFKEAGIEVFKPKDVLDLISIFSIGDIYIGNDSGPMHTAAALGLAVFAIYKPMASKVFYPITKQKYMIISDHPPTLDIEKVYQQYLKFVKPLGLNKKRKIR